MIVSLDTSIARNGLEIMLHVVGSVHLELYARHDYDSGDEVDWLTAIVTETEPESAVRIGQVIELSQTEQESLEEELIQAAYDKLEQRREDRLENKRKER